MARQYLKWYENHKAAFLAGKFDYDSFDNFKGSIDFNAFTAFNEGKTVRFVWDILVRELPITSQLMMSTELLGHIPKSAEAKLKRGFKSLETRLIASINQQNYSPQTNA